MRILVGVFFSAQLLIGLSACSSSPEIAKSVDPSSSEFSPSAVAEAEYADQESVDKSLTVKIGDGMPEFEIKLHAIYDGASNNLAVQTITVIDSSDGAVKQVIPIPELTMFGQTQIWGRGWHEDTTDLVFEDLNFDGYLDINLYDALNGNYRIERIYLVWNPEKMLFENDRRLNQIVLACFDQEKQLIYGMERGSAADHYYSTFQYIGGEPTLVRYLSQEGLLPTPEMLEYLEEVGLPPQPNLMGFHEVESVRVEAAGQMETVRDDYVFYDMPDNRNNSDEDMVGSFDASSEVGKQIAAMG